MKRLINYLDAKNIAWQLLNSDYVFLNRIDIEIYYWKKEFFVYKSGRIQFSGWGISFDTLKQYIEKVK